MVHRGFGRCIDGVVGAGPGRLARGDEQDRAIGRALGRRHRLGFGSPAHPGEHEVLVDDVSPVFAPVAGERFEAPPRRQHADVVDADVEPTERLGDVGHHKVGGIVVAAVGNGRDRRAALGDDLGDDRLGMFGPDVVDGDGGSRTGEPDGDLPADAGAGARDQRCGAGVIDDDAHRVIIPLR